MWATRLFNKAVTLFQKQESVNKFFSRARTLRAIKGERLLEYAWVLTHLGNSSGKRILDIGSTGSIFPLQIADLGHNVWSIDLRSYREWHKIIHPNMHFVKGDITQSPFVSDYFDVAIAVSTLEHIGTEDYFLIPVDLTKDFVAISEIARVLKNNGRFIFTVPYIKHCHSYVKCYDEERLNEMLNGLFSIETKEFFIQKNGFWSIASSNEITDQKEALVCVTATKNG